jgi:drug/metabolite transporter (DMT)-like permease
MPTIKLSKAKLAIIALILANVIWGATSPIFKWSLEDTSPFTFGFIRFMIATLIILPFTIHKLKISAGALVKLMAVAYLGLFLHITYLLFGLELSPSINAPIIGSSAPIFLIIGAMIFLREKPKRRVILGTVVSLIGVLFIIFQPIIETGLDGSLLGNIFFLLSMITAVIYVILLKKFNLHYDIRTITFWLFAITTFTYFPFFLWESQGVNLMAQMTPQALFGTLYGALFTSVIAYLCYNFALKYVVANETGIFFYVDPVVAIIVAIPLLHEKITTLFVIGSILVFLGIFVAERRIHFHPIHKLRG